MRTIEIDNELILVEVPKDAVNFELGNNLLYGSTLFFKINNAKHSGTDVIKGNFEIIGLIETPDLKFDFDVDETWVESIKQFSSVFITGHSIMYKDYMIINKNNEFCLLMKEDSFRTRIQKAIQDIEIKGNLLLIKKLK